MDVSASPSKYEKWTVNKLKCELSLRGARLTGTTKNMIER